MSRALLIVDHGSRRAEAHAYLEWVAAQVRERCEGLRVYIAHMELAPPSISDAIAECAADGVRQLDVHPLFLVPGKHLTEDIPKLVEDAARRHSGLRWRITAPVGSAPDLADLVLATLRE